MISQRLSPLQIILKTISPDSIFVLDGISAFLATLFLDSHDSLNFYILAQEGRENFSDTSKLSQWPYLITTYEATYELQGLFLETRPKK